VLAYSDLINARTDSSIVQFGWQEL
jgi:hypothetical protein